MARGLTTDMTVNGIDAKLVERYRVIDRLAG